jgi:hypothetical protein
MSVAACVLTAFGALWIDYGWQPLEGGGHEYIIQVPPELLESMRSGGIESYVPPDVQDIRRIRITVGSDPLPRTTAPAADKPTSTAEQADTQAPVPHDPRSGNGQQRIAKYPDASSGAAEANSGALPSTGGRIAALFDKFGADALTVSGIGLGLACALIVFLAWSHASMRTRYRALLHKHELRPPLNAPNR